MMNGCTEDLLLSRWRAGDGAAGDELVRMCRPVLRWFFLQRTSENVDELIQLTLVACVQALDQFEGRSSFKTFLLGIANKQFLMNLRATRTRVVASSLPRHQVPNPSQLFESKEEVGTVSAALNDTSPAFRQVLELFYWEELSVEEIAKTLEVPPGTVKSRLSRGRMMLKARIMAAQRAKFGNQTQARVTYLQPSPRAESKTTYPPSPQRALDEDTEAESRLLQGNPEDEQHVS
jgi:RNA polymerase sigma-70 factor, ECF subfamily